MSFTETRKAEEEWFCGEVAGWRGQEFRLQHAKLELSDERSKCSVLVVQRPSLELRDVCTGDTKL